MEFKGTKVDWIVSSDDIIHIDISNNNADLCILTEYKNQDLYNKNLASHAPEMLDFINRISGEMLRNDFVLNDEWYDQAKDLITRATTI